MRRWAATDGVSAPSTTRWKCWCRRSRTRTSEITGSTNRRQYAACSSRCRCDRQGPAGPASRSAPAVKVVIDQGFASGSEVRCRCPDAQTLGELGALGQSLVSRACRRVPPASKLEPAEPPVAAWFHRSVGEYAAFEWDDLASGIAGEAQVRDLLGHDLVESPCQRVWGTIWGKTTCLAGGRAQNRRSQRCVQKWPPACKPGGSSSSDTARGGRARSMGDHRSSFTSSVPARQRRQSSTPSSLAPSFSSGSR